MNLDFLKSVRFYKLLVIAVAQFLASQGILDSSVANALSLVLGGSVVIRTVDRFGDKFVEGAPK